MSENVKAGQDLNELFDVVNDRDEVLHPAPRHEVHARDWLHRAVHVFVFDAQGKLFLQQRSLLKDSEPGTWCASCCGHVDSGEDYDAAALRELQEEIGVVAPTPPQRWLRFRACAETGWEFLWVYKLTYSGPLTLNPAEIQDGDWFNIEQISQGVANSPEDFSESFRYLWARISDEL